MVFYTLVPKLRKLSANLCAKWWKSQGFNSCDNGIPRVLAKNFWKLSYLKRLGSLICIYIRQVFIDANYTICEALLQNVCTVNS